ncbi:MAG: NADH-quinone oxidoreductase subunit M [Acidimicrobiaceae bacterium]|nr:NADH-quinone oxidoreductase subunit M [Acidimicrobiaceae bacterium]MDE0667008.1 NADH-quinone oxidoreductase subunit M [Acidimicrobiaceae bacterium]MXY10622.1 NADH-quinone oxidoreductase subunit M [Acidimicrobiaceae bacterium]MXZ64761.1 NADH-quinone oxidoreductase subunit M [Acidimicrobiaceae bacterium]MYF32216.1 NADH-quinone oxidoreductase subunit M [Acidimicrobiaceae bacterium]
MTATASASFPAVLTVLVLVPAVGALVLAAMPRARSDLLKPVALLASVLPAALAVWLLSTFDAGAAGLFQFSDRYTWIEGLGVSWHVGVDGLSLFLVVMTALMFPLAIVGVDPEHSPKPYYAWLLILETGCLGTFVALDLIMFFVFFEIVLVPMYFLIGGWGHGRRAYAATKFFLFTMFGSAIMLVAIVALAFLHASASGGGVSFDLIGIAENQVLATNTARWLFLAFALAFAVKVPLFPVHTWLPDAHTNAPTAGSVILAAVMLKLGTYGLVRFGLYLFPEASVYFAPLMVTLGVIGIIYGAIAAAMQRDLKRLVAYSSVAHLGFIVIGTFALNTEGLTGGVLQMVNHGVSTGALFLLVGMIYERRHTREISDLGGLQKPAPVMAAVFTVVMLSSVGLPGLNGFVGELLVLLGAFNAHRWWAVVAAAGVILAAVYLLWAYQRVFHGPASGANAEMPDMRWREGLVMVPFLAAIVFMGVYPKPVIDRVEPAVDAIIAHVEDNVAGFAEPAADVQPPVSLDDLVKSTGYDDHGTEGQSSREDGGAGHDGGGG